MSNNEPSSDDFQLTYGEFEFIVPSPNTVTTNTIPIVTDEVLASQNNSNSTYFLQNYTLQPMNNVSASNIISNNTSIITPTEKIPDFQDISNSLNVVQNYFFQQTQGDFWVNSRNIYWTMNNDSNDIPSLLPGSSQTLYETNINASSSTPVTRRNRDKTAEDQMKVALDNNYKSLLKPIVLETISKLLGDSSDTNFQLLQNCKNNTTQNIINAFKSLLLRVDFASRYYILDIYKTKQNVIAQFFETVLQVNQTKLAVSKILIDCILDENEKKNALLNLLYSGEFATDATNGYTIEVLQNKNTVVHPPLWHILSSTKSTDLKDPISCGIGFLLANAETFTLNTVDQFSDAFNLLEKDSTKRVIVNLLMQYYFFDKCILSPSSMKFQDYCNKFHKSISSFFLLPKRCPINTNEQKTVLVIPLNGSPNLTNPPNLYIDNIEAKFNSKIGRDVANKHYIQYLFSFPLRDTEAIVDAAIKVSSFGHRLGIEKYVTYYAQSNLKSSSAFTSTTSTNLNTEQQPNQYKFTDDTLQQNTLQDKSNSIYEANCYHHQVYSNELSDSIDKLNASDRKYLFCFDRDCLGRTPFQLAFAVSTIQTISTMLSKLFNPLKFEDCIDLIYHLFHPNPFDEWAIGLAMQNVNLDFEQLCEYLKTTYQIIIPQDMLFEEEEEIEDDSIKQDQYSKTKLEDLVISEQDTKQQDIDNNVGVIRNIISTGILDSKLKVWDIASQQAIGTIQINNEFNILQTQNIIVWDKERVIGGYENGNIQIWNTNTQKLEYTFQQAHKTNILCLYKLNENQLVSGSEDKTLKIWNMETKECIQTLIGHTGWVTCIDKLDNETIVSGSFDSIIKLWNVKSGKCLNTIETDHKDWITSIVVLANKQYIVSGSTDKTLKVWNIETKQCIATLTEHFKRVNRVILMNENQIISGSSDTTICIWNTNTWKCESVIQNDSDVLSLVKVNEELIASGDLKGVIKIWNVRAKQCISQWNAHSNKRIWTLSVQ